jgi:hypothetical protein
MYHAEILRMCKRDPDSIDRQYVVAGENIADLVIQCAAPVTEAGKRGHVVRVSVVWRGDQAESAREGEGSSNPLGTCAQRPIE